MKLINSAITALVCLCGGCQSIQSEAVQKLIERESGKISEANVNVDKIVTATDDRISNLKNAVKALDAAMVNLRRIEAEHALVFSSNQNVTTKKGADAHAVGYLIATIFLAEESGLDAQVKQQFEDDQSALKQAATGLKSSWATLATSHKQLEEYSKKTILSNADPEFIAAVTSEIPGASDKLASVLAEGKKVNEALKTAASASPVGGSQISGAQTAVQDVIDVLTKATAKPTTQPSATP